MITTCLYRMPSYRDWLTRAKFWGKRNNTGSLTPNYHSCAIMTYNDMRDLISVIKWSLVRFRVPKIPG